MRDKKGRICIEICLGSSCFSRGNSRSLEILKSYIKDKGLEDKVDLRGSLCSNMCSSGPVLSVRGRMHYRVDPMSVVDIIEEELGKSSG